MAGGGFRKKTVGFACISAYYQLLCERGVLKWALTAHPSPATDIYGKWLRDRHGIAASLFALHRATNALLVDSGVTADQYSILYLLAVEDGITQQELVRRALSDPNTIASMLRVWKVGI